MLLTNVVIIKDYLKTEHAVQSNVENLRLNHRMEFLARSATHTPDHKITVPDAAKMHAPRVSFNSMEPVWTMVITTQI